MADYMTEEELQTALRETIKRCATDPAFRALAAADGNAAVALAGMKPLRPGRDFVFVENCGHPHKILVLPSAIPEPERLSDADLELVAGGCHINSCGAVGSLPFA